MKVETDLLKRAATLTVTGTFCPEYYYLEVSEDSGKTWHIVYPSKMADKDYTMPYGTKFTSVEGQDAVMTVKLTAMENYAKALQVRATPYKDGSFGNTSKAVKLSIAPAWASKDVKATATQTGEDEVTVSWKSAGSSDVWYYVQLQHSDETYERGMYTNKTTTTFTSVPTDSYTVTVQPLISTDEKGVTSTTSVTVSELWNKQTVVKVTKVTGVSISGTVTYYGQPDTVYVTANIGPDMMEPFTLKDLEYAGAKGKTVPFTIYVHDKDENYAPGTYSVQAYTTKTGSEPSEISKSVTAKVQDALLENSAKVKSLKYLNNNQQVVLTLSKAAGSAGTGRYVWVQGYGDAGVVIDFGDYKASTTSFTLDFDCDLDYSNVTLHIVPYVVDGEGTRVYGNALEFNAGDYLKADYWKTTLPDFTVVQNGYRGVSVQMTKGTAAQYRIVVTDLDHKTVTGSVYQGKSATVDVSELNANSTLEVAVMPLVSGQAKTDYTVKKTVSLKNEWNTVSGVTAATVKKSDYVTIQYNCVSMADGVYVRFCDAATGEVKLTAKFDYDGIDYAVGKKANTATLSVWPYNDRNVKLTGKYIIEVTPFLNPTSEIDSVVIGDSVNAARVLTLK